MLNALLDSLFRLVLFMETGSLWHSFTRLLLLALIYACVMGFMFMLGLIVSELRPFLGCFVVRSVEASGGGLAGKAAKKLKREKPVLAEVIAEEG